MGDEAIKYIVEITGIDIERIREVVTAYENKSN